MTEREALADLLEAVELAIYSGDWRVDGACEPDAAIQRAKNVLAHPKQQPVAKNEEGRIKWLIDNWPQNCLLYTNPPQSFTYEQVKAHIRAALLPINNICIGSDITEDGVSIVIRQGEQVIDAKFYKIPKRIWVGLTDEEFDHCDAHETWRSMKNVEAKLKEKNVPKD